jgi:hypothetical protein
MTEGIEGGSGNREECGSRNAECGNLKQRALGKGNLKAEVGMRNAEIWGYGQRAWGKEHGAKGMAQRAQGVGQRNLKSDF